MMNDDGGYSSSEDSRESSDFKFITRLNSPTVAVPRQSSEFNSLSVDEQIQTYEALQNLMYPNNRLEEVAAKNTHLRRTVHFPSPVEDRPRTEEEKQWMLEHSSAIYKRPGGSGNTKVKDEKKERRKSLHENFLTNRKTMIVHNRKSTFPDPDPRPTERGVSLAEMADPGAFRNYDESDTKSKILRSLTNRTDEDLIRQSGLKGHRH